MKGLVGVIISVVLVIFLIIGMPLLSNTVLAIDSAHVQSWLVTNGYTAYASPSGDFTVPGDLVAATGRGATLVVAANDATALEKAQADYVWDGTGDATAEVIQPAIDAAELVSGSVYLTNGTFNIITTITINASDTTLFGSGKGTILNSTSLIGINIVGDIASNTKGITIRNLKIVMPNTTAGENGILVDYSDYFLIDNIELTDSKDDGIKVSHDCDYGLITGSHIHDNDNAGILFNQYAGGGNKVDHSIIEYNKYGVYTQATHTMITTNYIGNNTDGGVYAASGDAQIVGNDISANGVYGITQKTGAGLITGNVIARTGLYPVVTPAGGRAIVIQNANGLTVTGNHINHTYYGTNNLGEGIYVYGTSADIAITGNTIWDLPVDTGAGVNGIDLQVGDNIVVSGNEIHDVTGYSVNIASNVTNSLISGNLFNDYDLGAVNNLSSTTTVRDNKGYVTENSGSTIILSGDNATTVTHGLATTPTFIGLTGTHSEVKDVIATSANSTTFVIQASGNVTDNRTVYWRATVGAGN